MTLTMNVTESAAERPLDLDGELLPLRDERHYGRTLLRFHEAAAG